MKISNYEINLKEVIDTINTKDYEEILIQIPEGLKTHTLKIIEEIEEKTRASCIASADPCYGACDIPQQEYNQIDVDLVVQIGHTTMPCNKPDFPMLFIDADLYFDIDRLYENIEEKLTGKKIGLVTTAQHVKMLDKIKKYLEKKDLQPIIEKGDGRLFYPGQIIGCNFSSATKISEKVDCFLFIGTGDFHPMGLTLSTEKPIVTYNPFTKKARKDELKEIKDRILRQRYGAIASCEYAKIFGILIDVKKGQFRKKTALKTKQRLIDAGRKPYLLSINDFSPSKIEGYSNIDCFVSTACPRIAIDDYRLYKKTVLTPVEVEILVGDKKWEDYSFDEIRNGE
ncbi:MAG: diphthamide biosynthesis enzyme Dph2 [Candidatus Thermoplasmatota archaeon]